MQRGDEFARRRPGSRQRSLEPGREVPHVRGLTQDGSGSWSSRSQNVPSTSSIASTTIACSSRFFAEASSASALARSSSGIARAGSRTGERLDRIVEPTLGDEQLGRGAHQNDASGPSGVTNVNACGSTARKRCARRRGPATVPLRPASCEPAPPSQRAPADPIDRRGHHRLVSSADGMAVTCDGGNGSAGAPTRRRAGTNGDLAVARDQLDQPGLTGCSLHTRCVGTCIQARRVPERDLRRPRTRSGPSTASSRSCTIIPDPCRRPPQSIAGSVATRCRSTWTATPRRSPALEQERHPPDLAGAGRQEVEGRRELRGPNPESG